jgi:hypothetical protein
MPRSLPPGLYEQVLTEGFREQLRRAKDLVVATSQLDADEAHLFLSRHVHGLLQSALQAYPQKDRLEHQLDLSNQILNLLASEFPGDFSADDHVTQQLLESLFPRQAPHFRTPALLVQAFRSRNRSCS